MAITKLMNMKSSKTGKIDVHLKNSIQYILNPKKLGDANLAGGINCLPDLAYEQMKGTKELFGKAGGRQGYHYVISLKPGEGTPEIMYEIAMEFAERLFQGEYEVVIAVHTDKEHTHAHLVFNSVNMMTGHKYQYHNGDWQRLVQPITNELCEKYGLHITPAEYSKDPTNISRPQWEKEKSYNQLIKDDVMYCAVRAENMEHFLFLMRRLGYEVKDGAHISVKAPGMKRTRRIDTLSDDFSKDNLETLIKYSDAQFANRKNVIPSYVFVKRAKLTPMQKKYYTKLYRRQKIVKQPFTHHSAYLQEEIRKMHQYQEEYLLLVKYDVKEILDVYETIEVLENKEKEIATRQKALYGERDSLKKQCKTESDFVHFRNTAESYYQELNGLKSDKKKCRSERKILNRILDREYSAREDRIDKELEREIPVGNMDDPDIGRITDVEVPENPYRIDEFVRASDVGEKPGIEDEKTEDVSAVVNATVTRFTESDPRETNLLPANVTEYSKLSMDEKLQLFHIGNLSDDEAYHMVIEYLDEIHYSDNLSELHEECMAVISAYQKKLEQTFIDTEVQQAMYMMETMGMTVQQFEKVDAGMKAMLFDFGSMGYQQGLQVYKALLDKIGIHREPMEVYEEFDAVYEVSIRGKQKSKNEKRERETFRKI